MNRLDIGIGSAHRRRDDQNRTTYHNFKPLADLLDNVRSQGYDVFNGEFDAYKKIEPGHRIECYYLMDSSHEFAIGWIHNMNAYWEKHFYVTHGVQNFLGCTAPEVDWHGLYGFQPGVDYHVSWFPTRMNTNVCPDNYVDDTETGWITLDLSTAPLGDTANSYLDTLHTDYAFVISVAPVHRSMTYATEADTISDSNWDFGLYPNPADDQLNLILPDDAPKDITIYDLSGRQLRDWGSVSGPLLRLPVGQLARGVYYIRVSDGAHSQVKELIIR